MALHVKRQLVDAGQLHIRQAQLDAVLSRVLREQGGVGPEFCQVYATVTRFFQQRRPLVILVCGSKWTGEGGFVCLMRACV